MSVGRTPPACVFLTGLFVSSALCDASIRHGVQLAAYRSEPLAWTGWRMLLAEHADLLSELSPALQRVDLGPPRGVFIRLQAGWYSERAPAEELCVRLKSRGRDCIVVQMEVSEPPRASTEPRPAPRQPVLEEAIENGELPGESPGSARTEADSKADAAAPSSNGPELREETDPFHPDPVQQVSPPPLDRGADEPRRYAPAGYVQALVGLTFETETDRFTGGGFGVNITPSVEIIGEIGYLRNILPRAEQSNVDLTLEGSRFRVDAKTPFFYGLGGVRAVLPRRGLARPYASASIGFAHGSPELHYSTQAGGDVTADVEAVGIDRLDPLDDVHLRERASTLNLLLGLGGGVNLGRGRGLSFDVGYRYLRMFDTRLFFGRTVQVNSAYAAVGYTF